MKKTTLLLILSLFAFAPLSAQLATDASVKSNSVVGGVAANIAVTPTISTSAYSVGDNLGGVVTYSNILRTSGATGIITCFEIWDKDNQAAEITVDVWDALPNAGTYTDNAAQVIAGDHAKWLGSFTISSSDWVVTGAVARATIKGINLLVKGNASRHLYFTFIVNSAATYSTTSSLVTKAGLLQD